MQAVRIYEFGGADNLRLEEVPRLRAERGAIIARIRAAGVNPVDWKIRQGYLKDRVPASFPLTLGQDFAGEVAETGAEAGRFHSGDRIFGFARGAYAEYAAAGVDAIALLPDGLQFTVAAALPTPGSTALQLVRDVVHAQPRLTLLIHGAAGAVGSCAAQLARRMGARVIATALGGEDVAWLRELGVETAIDVSRERFEDAAGEVDAVVDLVGGDTLARSYGVVKKGGVLATTVAPVDEAAAARAGIRVVQFIMRRSAADLAELAQLAARGELKIRLGPVFELRRAREAQELSQQGKVQGKLILQVA